MSQFTLQPDLYKTGSATDLFEVLSDVWPKKPDSAEDYFVVSGFGSFNGGVSFYERFRALTATGRHVTAVFGGSRSTNQTSRQLTDALLDCGVDVHIVNRRYMMHSKLYGAKADDGKQKLVITSGNFTGPGIARNVESTLALTSDLTSKVNFDWDGVMAGLLHSGLDVFTLNSATEDDPRWNLLYDEGSRDSRKPTPEDNQDILESLIVTLGHADTARIQAARGTDEGKGSQYFWLSTDSYSFFPPLTIRNRRGRKATYSCLINVNFVSLSEQSEVRVTFEAENNRDFRLGTGRLRHTGAASAGDLAVLSRRGEYDYELRIVPAGTSQYFKLSAYATAFIGAQGKRYGYAPNSVVDRALKGVN
ncbi:phospholipase D-like domain-containing protein [Nocardioides sp. R-C-SC26]|uniref:phospholipase D-like domain-containing protein n=1 Tax=Nocardioides sp. R-C-SC26 TaxID=2870414 RepID=UPI001E53DD37|nr:phospholipase D-like domain-containing protein [Nocardioides sp. R-C-SC26]